MKTKIITISLTIIFINTFFTILSSNDRVSHFIPFIKILSSGHFAIDAYSFFFIITALLFRIIFLSSNVTINLSTLRVIPQIFQQQRFLDFAIIIGTGLVTNFFFCPILYQIFIEPISAVIQSPSPIRRIILVMLPMLWILLIGLINRGGINLWKPTNRQHTQIKPNPSTW